LKDLESKIDSRTKLIIITDPSNPCGSVFSEQHLRDLMTLAAQYQVVVVTDEVYENMTFNNIKFQRVTDVNEDVPVITCGGIPKRYVVPGWRCGWVVVFDRKRILEKAVSCFVSVRIAQLKTPLLFLAGCC
jgi:tyrosine aminotransferase